MDDDNNGDGKLRFEDRSGSAAEAAPSSTVAVGIIGCCMNCHKACVLVDLQLQVAVDDSDGTSKLASLDFGPGGLAVTELDDGLPVALMICGACRAKLGPAVRRRAAELAPAQLRLTPAGSN